MLSVDVDRGLYPELVPNQTGKLRVDDIHSIYWEESGNPSGKPVVFLHGGPGGGTEPKHRRFFDPSKYRIVLFDQRGCGKSTPHASLEGNTTWDLVADIERLREHLGVECWQVFGGSWGSTLALAYAQSHPERVTELVLRGIFTFAPDEIAWFYARGTNAIYPEPYEELVGFLPLGERDRLIESYYRRLTSDDRETRAQACRTWSRWECSVGSVRPDPDLISHCDNPAFTTAFARIECHYFVHGGFFRPMQLLEDLPKITHIPTAIVHGRYDLICPLRNAWRLHRAWPGSTLHIVEGAGHTASDPGMAQALVAATDAFAAR